MGPHPHGACPQDPLGRYGGPGWLPVSNEMQGSRAATPLGRGHVTARSPGTDLCQHPTRTAQNQ